LIAVEGAIRLCSAAFSETPLGIFPLFALDKIFFGVFRRKRGAYSSGPEVNALGSFAGAILERAAAVGSSALSDAVCFRGSGADEILEIYASRRKQDWTPPRVVRYLDGYYRLESDARGAGARPFRYTLRRLPAGVPGRTVLVYSPSDAVIRNPR